MKIVRKNILKVIFVQFTFLLWMTESLNSNSQHSTNINNLLSPFNTLTKLSHSCHTIILQEYERE